jgi:hypothetical protein
MIWCHASELLGASALYLLLHLMAYTLLFRRWAAFVSAFSTRVYVPLFGYTNMARSLFLTRSEFMITHNHGALGSLKTAGV